jgi:hypothetical protein
MDMLMNTDSYFETLESIKAQIKNAQYRAVLGANREQILLYWSIGKVIIDNSSYGNNVQENNMLTNGPSQQVDTLGRPCLSA